MSRETSSPSPLRSRPVEKAAFVLSVAVLAFLYGIATEAFGWPPSAFLTRAWHQFRAVAGLQEVNERLTFLEPRVYDRAGVRAVRPDRTQPGLTLVASYWEEHDWRPALRLIDASGRVVHEWPPEAFDVFSDSADRRPEEDVDRPYRPLHGFHLDPDGDVVVNVEHVGTVRLDACGNVLWTVERGNHHSIEKAADGSFWIPGALPATDGGGRPGLPDRILGETILHVSGAGEVLSETDLLDVLRANGLMRHAVDAIAIHGGDFVHLNDIEALPAVLAGEYPRFEAGDLLVSMRNLDLVMVLDPDTGVVKWHASHPFLRQHDPDWLGDGWIGVFDNRFDDTPRGSMLGGSRVVAIRPHDGETRTWFPTDLSEPLYTPFMGEWQRLENGSMLLVESVAGRVVEVAPDGRTVWEWVVDPYEEEWVPWVTGARRVSIEAGDVAAWGCGAAGAEPEDPAP